jgi:hypothetical protein
MGIIRRAEDLLSYGQMNLIFHARSLWREFAIWGRVYLISRIAGIGITDEVFDRLYRIPLEFGDLIKIIFGDQMAENIIQQLSYSVIVYRDLVEAIMAGDTGLANQKAKDLYQNADERAAYLASINPYWSEAEWKSLIYTFYSYSFDEIETLLTNDPKNIDVFDRFLQFTDVMGDYLSQGLFDYLAHTPLNQPVNPKKCRKL